MGGGLKNQWGVSDPAQAGSDKQSKNFQAGFQLELGKINGHLQYTATHAEAAKHGPLAGRRDKLIGAFQGALAKIDPKNENKAAAAIAKVMGDAAMLSPDVAKFRAEAEKAYNDWQAAKPKFDGAVKQIEELETWEDPGAKELRAAATATQKQDNSRQYAAACKALEALLPKLKPVYEEYLKQKAAKEKYDPALNELQPRLAEALVFKYNKLKPMQDDMGTLQKDMEAAATKKDYVTALKIITDLKTKVETYEKDREELEKLEKAYNDTLTTLQPKLTQVSSNTSAKLAQKRDDISMSQGVMEAAAKDEEFAKASAEAASLNTLADAYIAEVAELEKQKKAYEEALAAVQSRFAIQSQLHPKLETIFQEINTLHTTMLDAAKQEDYARAAQLAKDAAVKLDTYEKDKANLDAQQQAYEAELKKIQPQLADVEKWKNEEVRELKIEINDLRAQMETAAKADEFEKAIKLVDTIALRIKSAEDADRREGTSFSIDWESKEFGKWGQLSKVKGGFKVKVKGKGELMEVGAGGASSVGLTANKGVKGDIELAKQKAVDFLFGMTLSEVKESFTFEVSQKKVDISLTVKGTIETGVKWFAPVLSGKFVLVGAEWKKLQDDPDSLNVAGLDFEGGGQFKGKLPIRDGTVEASLALEVVISGSVKPNWPMILPEIARKAGTRVAQMAATALTADAIIVAGFALGGVAVIVAAVKGMAEGAEVRGLFPLSEKLTGELAKGFMAGATGGGAPGGMGATGHAMGQKGYAALKAHILKTVPDATDEEVRGVAQEILAGKDSEVWAAMNPHAKQAVWQAYAQGHKGDKRMLRPGWVNLFGKMPDESNPNYAKYLNDD